MREPAAHVISLYSSRRYQLQGAGGHKPNLLASLPRDYGGGGIPCAERFKTRITLVIYGFDKEMQKMPLHLVTKNGLEVAGHNGHAIFTNGQWLITAATCLWTMATLELGRGYK